MSIQGLGASCPSDNVFPSAGVSRLRLDVFMIWVEAFRYLKWPIWIQFDYLDACQV